MSKRKKTYDDDDGRVIANMNVDGMPWYVEGDEDREKGLNASAHEQMTEEELTAAGISPDLIRLSCGLENSLDLIADIEQALNNID